MAYCVTGDVAQRLPGRDFFQGEVTGRTIVTVADVEEFIEISTREIDAVLRYLDLTMPVVAADSPKGYSILTTINTYGAAALAEEAWSMPGGGGSKSAQRLRSRYNNYIESLLSHTIDLIDTGGGPAMSDAVADSGNLDVDDDGLERDPMFASDMEW